MSIGSIMANDTIKTTSYTILPARDWWVGVVINTINGSLW